MDVAESATYAEIHDEPQLPRPYVTSATKSTQIHKVLFEQFSLNAFFSFIYFLQETYK